MRALTKAEEQVMLILWEMKEGLVKDVIDKMEPPKPAYNMVSTVIRVLEGKGFLDHKAIGNTHNLLFIHPHLAEKQTFINHKMVHIKQKHSVDTLFFELLQIICWFNPIIYFIKKDIKLLHEYIADELIN